MSPQSNTGICVLPVLVNQPSHKPLLQVGSEGAKVSEVQKLLIHWNLYSGSVDGSFSTQLEQAVRTFQRRMFLPDDGVVDPLTWRSLYAGTPIDMPLLQNGSSGTAVILLQTALRSSGQTDILLDGKFGQQTEAAVRHFQRCKGLVVDGIVGSCTWLTLSKIPR